MIRTTRFRFLLPSKTATRQAGDVVPALVRGFRNQTPSAFDYNWVSENPEVNRAPELPPTRP